MEFYVSKGSLVMLPQITVKLRWKLIASNPAENILKQNGYEIQSSIQEIK